LGNARIDGGPVRRSIVGRQHPDRVRGPGQGLAHGHPDATTAEIERKDDLARSRAAASGWR
jgi:hypothetical protein